MISYIKGEIQYIDDSSISIISNGIGWDIHAFIPEQYTPGNVAEFYVYTHFRESEISLWGFKSVNELQCFKLLISVSGVGPKTAQLLVGDRGVDKICFAILNNDAATLRVPGVGSKTSQKIIIELKNKVGKLQYNSPSKEGESVIITSDYSELYDALGTLGYKYNDVKIFIDKLEITTELSTEELIKLFLRSS